MAGTRGIALSSNQSGVGSTTAQKTILRLTAPAAVAVFVTAMHVSFDGTTANAAKVLVEIVRSATGGTATTLSPAPDRLNASDAEAIASTAKENFSAEPSGGVVIARRWVHPQSDYTFRMGVKVKAGENLDIRVKVATAVNVQASFEFEE